MNRVPLFARNVADGLQRFKIVPISYNHLRYSSDSKDDPTKPSEKGDSFTGVTVTKDKKNSSEALNKLNTLLKKISEEKIVKSSGLSLELAKPKDKRKKPKSSEDNAEQNKSHEQKIAIAAKNVAEKIGGDVKQTEMELLSKLLKTSETKATKMELSDIIKGMQIDRESKVAEQETRAQQVRQLLEMVKGKQQKASQTRPADKVLRKTQSPRRRETLISEESGLFNSEPLGIFTADKDLLKDEGEVNETWKNLYERELRLAVTHPPSNYFQQMILWTEQGKIWKFPIDNEQGLEKEQNVYFTEHVFLEKHLEPWCPPKGPLRHFMELVCVGLSKNPYMTVETKKEHIEWYKNYFEDKKQLLQEVGVILPETKSVASKSTKDNSN